MLLAWMPAPLNAARETVALYMVIVRFRGAVAGGLSAAAPSATEHPCPTRPPRRTSKRTCHEVNGKHHLLFRPVEAAGVENRSP